MESKTPLKLIEPPDFFKQVHISTNSYHAWDDIHFWGYDMGRIKLVEWLDSQIAILKVFPQNYRVGLALRAISPTYYYLCKITNRKTVNAGTKYPHEEADAEVYCEVAAGKQWKEGIRLLKEKAKEIQTNNQNN